MYKYHENWQISTKYQQIFAKMGNIFNDTLEVKTTAELTILLLL